MIKTSANEIKELTKAWLAISLAFGIATTGLSFTIDFVYAVIIAAFTVGIGFLFHEMAHKLVAQRYGCFAEFRAFDMMLLLAILMSFSGFIFAAPGAVFISGYVNKEKNGRISAAGATANLILALLFLLISLVIGKNLITHFGFLINTWLALFNMVPFGNFDGIKILRWSKGVYGLMVTVSIIFFLMSSVL